MSDPRDALFFPRNVRSSSRDWSSSTRRTISSTRAAWCSRWRRSSSPASCPGSGSAFSPAWTIPRTQRAEPITPSTTSCAIRRDLGGQSSAGIVYTEKIDGPDYNRVAGANARIVFGGTHTAAVQGAGSITRIGGATVAAPLWYASLDRTGQRFGYTYAISAIAPDFVAASGFIPARASRIGNHRPPGDAVRAARRWRRELDGRPAAARPLVVSAPHERAGPGRSILPRHLDLAAARLDPRRRPCTSSPSRSTRRTTRPTGSSTPPGA